MIIKIKGIKVGKESKSEGSGMHRFVVLNRWTLASAEDGSKIIKDPIGRM
jgi:hypothetical protein